MFPFVSGLLDVKFDTHRPQFLFKYRPWKTTFDRDPNTGEVVEHHRTRDLLKNAEFYCQPPRFFDDPHDAALGARPTGSPTDIDRHLRHDLNGIGEIMRKHNLGSLTQLKTITDPDDQRTLRRLARRAARRETRVLSLSETPISELMWAFYADNHQGICLCFDGTYPFFEKARPVRYAASPMDVSEPAEPDVLSDPLLYCKSTSWMWQFEWRMAWAGETPRCIAFPRDALKGVILGEWFQESQFEELKRTLICGGYQVTIHRIERIPESFQFEVSLVGRIGRISDE